MAAVSESAGSAGAVKRRTRLQRLKENRKLWRGVLAIVAALVLWEIGSRWDQWFGYTLPFIGLIPPPTDVAVAWVSVLPQPGYWESWYLSFNRVLAGFLFAQLIGIPLGLALAVNRYFREFFFPVFEILRPIPPLAWVPASLIFWPTNEMSIAFVTFLGAFFTIVINVLGGARTIDISLLRAAQSMGATQWDMFWKIVLPGTLPSIFTGAAVGMGDHLGGRAGGGDDLGRGDPGRRRSRLLHLELVHGRVAAAHRGGHDQHRIAGYLSSSAIRWLGDWSMPWRRLF